MHLHAVIAVLTYKRPELLRVFLEAFERMEIPERIQTTLLVVDNDADASSRTIVEQFGSRLGRVVYVVEPARGIPVARNRALAEAEGLGGDVLCFIDDDEYPDDRWLAALIDTRRKTGAQMVGGPVRIAPASKSLSIWKRLVNKSLMVCALRQERKMAKIARTSGEFTLATNNWLGDIAWLRERNIRFDTDRYRRSGGSDTEFFLRAREAGCVAAWSPQAVVYETMLPGRLSLAYQLARGRNQSMTHFHMKHGRSGPKLAARTASVAMARIALGGLLLVFPVFGVASPVAAVRSIGWGLGRADALRGRRSNHYE